VQNFTGQQKPVGRLSQEDNILPEMIRHLPRRLFKNKILESVFAATLQVRPDPAVRPMDLIKIVRGNLLYSFNI